MQPGAKTAALVLVLAAISGVGVFAWLTNRLPWSPAQPNLGDGGDGSSLGDGAAASAHRQTAPLSSAQLGAPLVSGAWVTACGAPDTMKIAVKLDVKLGRAVKVDVKTDPPDPTVTACVDKAAREMRWDVSPATGHVTVRY